MVTSSLPGNAAEFFFSNTDGYFYSYLKIGNILGPAVCSSTEHGLDLLVQSDFILGTGLVKVYVPSPWAPGRVSLERMRTPRYCQIGL